MSLYLADQEFVTLVLDAYKNDTLSTLIWTMSNVPILILDDLFSRNQNSEVANTVIRQVINSRWNDPLEHITLWASNFEREAMITKDGPVFSRLSDAKFTRMVESFGTPDYRRVVKR